MLNEATAAVKTEETSVVNLAEHRKADNKKQPAKKATAPKTASPKEATPKTKTGKKITILAKECPVRKGTNRAKFWAKLKSGMTMAAAKEANVPVRFIKKMAKAKHLTIG